MYYKNRDTNNIHKEEHGDDYTFTLKSIWKD